jgi:hypothetical protein
MFFPLLDHNITCSHLRVTLLALVLVSISFWSEALHLGRLLFGKWCYCSLEGLQLGFGFCFLHDLVSVLHQNFLIEWLLFSICIYCYLVVISLILETLGSQHTSRSWLYVPMNKALSHLI